MPVAAVMFLHQLQGPVELLGDGGDDYDTHQRDHQKDGHENGQNRQQAAFQLDFILEELDKRLHHISQQPGNQER